MGEPEPGCSGCYWTQPGTRHDSSSGLSSDSFYSSKPRLRSKIFDSETDLSQEPFPLYYSSDERLDDCVFDGEPAGSSSQVRRRKGEKKSARDTSDRWGLCWQDVRSLPRTSGGSRSRKSRGSSRSQSGSNTRSRRVLSWLNLMSDTEPKNRKKSKLNLQDEFDNASDIFLGLDQITFADSEPEISIEQIQALHLDVTVRARSDFVDDILESMYNRGTRPSILQQQVLAGVNPRRGLSSSSVYHNQGTSQKARSNRSQRGSQSIRRGGGGGTGREEDVHRSMPFIQSVDDKQVLVGRVEPLHVSRAMRRREHVLHCYEFKLMLRLDQDVQLWNKLCDRFGYCDECKASKDAKVSCTASRGQHNSSQLYREIFRGVDMNPDLWFLAVTLKESKDKLIHFIRSEMPRRNAAANMTGGASGGSGGSHTHHDDSIWTLPPTPRSFCTRLHDRSFLTSYLNTFNFVELRLDSIIEKNTELSPCIYQCRNVRILSLKNNFLQKISPEIGNLIRLEKLYLTHNELQIESIPYTLTFCRNLKEAFFDNNLLNALPCILLRIDSLQRVHRHGNHNYFKDTFMFYHTDINDRIKEVPRVRRNTIKLQSLQEIAGYTVLTTRLNFYAACVPTRLKQFLTQLSSGIELCDHCSRILFTRYTSHFKVITFKNPYLGNTCVPFQHTACSEACAQNIEVPARYEQLLSAQQQDSEYQEYIRESLNVLNHRQNSVGGLSDSFCSRSSRNSQRRCIVSRGKANFSIVSSDITRSNSSNSVAQNHMSCGIF